MLLIITAAPTVIEWWITDCFALSGSFLFVMHTNYKAQKDTCARWKGSLWGVAEYQKTCITRKINRLLLEECVAAIFLLCAVWGWHARGERIICYEYKENVKGFLHKKIGGVWAIMEDIICTSQIGGSTWPWRSKFVKETRIFNPYKATV